MLFSLTVASFGVNRTGLCIAEVVRLFPKTSESESSRLCWPRGKMEAVILVLT